MWTNKKMGQESSDEKKKKKVLELCTSIPALSSALGSQLNVSPLRTQCMMQNLKSWPLIPVSSKAEQKSQTDEMGWNSEKLLLREEGQVQSHSCGTQFLLIAGFPLPTNCLSHPSFWSHCCARGRLSPYHPHCKSQSTDWKPQLVLSSGSLLPRRGIFQWRNEDVLSWGSQGSKLPFKCSSTRDGARVSAQSFSFHLAKNEKGNGLSMLSWVAIPLAQRSRVREGQHINTTDFWLLYQTRNFPATPHQRTTLFLQCKKQTVLSSFPSKLRHQCWDCRKQKKDTVHYNLQKIMNLIILPCEKSITF